MKKLLKNYISALYSIAVKHKEIEKITRSLSIFSDVLANNNDFKKIVLSPVFSSTVKIRIINSIFSEIMPGYFVKFLSIILKNNRARLLPYLRSAWDEFVKLRSDICNVVITLAKEPDQDERKSIKLYLAENISNYSFEIRYNIDPSLVSGFTIMTGNRIYDNSVKGHIAQIKKLLN